MPDNATTPLRRTQQERREATIRKLLDAARESLIEVGYANTSIQQICQRAGVSQGGLFRHFKTRLDLLIEVADDVSNALIDHYDRRFQALNQEDDPFRLALGLLRENCRARDNEAWFELILAARTDTTLRTAMVPIWRHNRERTLERAISMFPGLAQKHPDFPAFVDCIVNQFHGETINGFIENNEAADRERLECSLAMIRQYAER